MKQAGRRRRTLTDIGFYHLTRTDVLSALPKLLGRTLATGQRAVVLCTGEPTVPVVSSALWDGPDWLPHGSAGHCPGRPDWQPIWLAASPGEAAPNDARFLFLVGAAPHAPGFDRIFDLFDGNKDIELVQARQRWSAAKAAGHRLTYWQQGDRGWVAKA